jgi:hypothetical protein
MRLLKNKALICNFVFYVCILFFAGIINAEVKIKDTRHNLSVSGTGVYAREETQICIFCHTPHNAYPNPDLPLWNHNLSSVDTYKVFWSDQVMSYTLAQSQAWIIDGASKLCLSCHDGTVAVGAVQSRNIESGTGDIEMSPSDCIDASGKLMASCRGYLGTDLSGGHPVSIILDQDLIDKRMQNNLSAIRIPNDPDVKLYPKPGCSQRCSVQCTSCHNPHFNRALPSEVDPDDPTIHNWPPFWQKETHDAVCSACHDPIPPADFEW